MILVKDKNGNKLFELQSLINEDFIQVNDSKLKILEIKEENDNKIVIVDTNLLLED